MSRYSVNTIGSNPRPPYRPSQSGTRIKALTDEIMQCSQACALLENWRKEHLGDRSMLAAERIAWEAVVDILSGKQDLAVAHGYRQCEKRIDFAGKP
jgi:hypothetical protein